MLYQREIRKICRIDQSFQRLPLIFYINEKKIQLIMVNLTRKQRQGKLVWETRALSSAGKSKKEKENTKQSQTKSLLRSLLIDGDNKFICPDIFIGSSQLDEFLRGRFSLKTAHKHMRSQQNQKIGRIGEALCYKQFKIVLEHPFRRHPDFKFICSTPDFIADIDGKPVLIECKTAQNSVQAKQMFHTLPMRYLLQVWISMDIYQIEKAKLCIYTFNNGVERSVKCIGIYNIIRKCQFIDKGIAELIQKRYSIFLSKYMKYIQQNYQFNRNEYNQILNDLIDNRKLRKIVKLKNVKKLDQPSPFKEFADVCYSLGNVIKKDLKTPEGSVQRFNPLGQTKKANDKIKSFKNILEMDGFKYKADDKSIKQKKIILDDSKLDEYKQRYQMFATDIDEMYSMQDFQNDQLKEGSAMSETSFQLRQQIKKKRSMQRKLNRQLKKQNAEQRKKELKQNQKERDATCKFFNTILHNNYDIIAQKRLIQAEMEIKELKEDKYFEYLKEIGVPQALTDEIYRVYNKGTMTQRRNEYKSKQSKMNQNEQQQ